MRLQIGRMIENTRTYGSEILGECRLILRDIYSLRKFAHVICRDFSAVKFENIIGLLVFFSLFFCTTRVSIYDKTLVNKPCMCFAYISYR